MATVPTVTIPQLLDAGAHFGHKAWRWNPKMAPYIYGINSDNLHTIDLRQTAVLMNRSLKLISDTVAKGGKILFVSTKVQARDIIPEFAEKCGQFYVNHRWLGGTLTNWRTISRSIKTLDNFENVLEDEDAATTYTKKELLNFTKKKDKLLRSLGGVRNIGDTPSLIVIIDTNKEHLAIKEAAKLGIPVIAIVDSNSDPDSVTYPIPGNDDAIRSIRLYCELFAEAALAGIEAALAASGVDIGAMSDTQNSQKNRDFSGVSKLKPTNKISKASDLKLQDIKNNGEFEAGLESEAKKNASPKSYFNQD